MHANKSDSVSEISPRMLILVTFQSEGRLPVPAFRWKKILETVCRTNIPQQQLNANFKLFDYSINLQC